MKYKKERKQKKPAQSLREAAKCDKDGIPSDTDGSYVGTGIDGTAPIQDSDDL